MSADLTGLALVIGAVLTPLSVMYLAWLNNRNVKGVKAVADETLATTTLINHAVNGKDPRMSTLSEDVITIRDKQETDMPSAEPAPTNGEAVLPLLREIVSRLDRLEGKTVEEGT